MTEIADLNWLIRERSTTIAGAVATFIKSLPLDVEGNVDFPEHFWENLSNYEFRKGERLYPYGFKGHLDPTEVLIFKDYSALYVTNRHQICSYTDVEELDSKFLKTKYFDEFLNEELSYEDAIALVTKHKTRKP